MRFRRRSAQSELFGPSVETSDASTLFLQVRELA